ncbi:hypothetical protein PIROE2DRAFT_58476 [Piromyces sp. E2]|nr:hypothetical protein PIROE2DRAFT_58476 [Piromyces sp. E2]|eukprot:OUM67884.1 hypothetical protein PIROE2DRAFT_58476 [Piromyces sp. E2]
MTSFAFETLLRDPTKSVPGTQESLLYNKVKDLQRLQDKLYQGKLGLPSTTKMRYLDDFIINKSCKLDEDVCENLEEIPEIGFTKNIVQMGMNEILDEMINAGMAIVQSVNIKDYKTNENLYENFLVGSKECIERCFMNPNFYFIYSILDHAIAALKKSEEVLFSNVMQSVRETMTYLIFIILLDIILFIVSFVITYRVMKSTNKILEELVNIIFLIPQSTINMIPQFKRFIETGSFEEE